MVYGFIRLGLFSANVLVKPMRRVLSRLNPFISFLTKGVDDSLRECNYSQSTYNEELIFECF